jgi:hypothetical protein
MTALVAEREVGALVPPPGRSRMLRRPPLRLWAPVAIAVLNATLFVIVRPGVNDLWAARARASAVAHGVGLTYWFSWFGGGSTPGNYSVLTPYLSALLTAELVGALSAVAITLLTPIALRGTRYAVAGSAVATLGAGINLWSGRVPFLLGSALGVAAIIAVVSQRRGWAAVATVASILASPVSGAFLALGLSGAFLTRRQYRVISGTTIATVVVCLGLVALAFGTPGPQNFSWWLCWESLGFLVLFLLARPPQHLRVVLVLSMATALTIAIVPNGMGSNFARMIWFCLPVAVVATSGRRVWVALTLVAPVLVVGANLTVSDLRQAGQPVAETAYYTPLANQLDQIGGLQNFRVEVVSQIAHAAYAALLDHAMLARGWETQEDNHLNATLKSAALDATSYKVWLDDNSVGYVAFPQTKAETYPEYTLVQSGLPYLHLMWRSADWTLYRVSDATPIVAAPQSVVSYEQSKLTVRTDCACRFSVRIRYSKYLRADPLPGHPGTAVVTQDGYGFTRVTATVPGEYVLHGSDLPVFH